MKLIVLSGFLGTGKTTCILLLAEYILKQNIEKKMPLVIIENEVGQTGVDDEIIRQKGYEVKTLLSGCICCTLNTSLIATLKEIKEKYDPEYVIFEPSGVAYPDRILKSLKEEYAPDIVWCRQITFVDVSRWNKIKRISPNLCNAQVANAQFVCMNKCDLVDESIISEIEEEIKALNPTAHMIRTVANKGIGESFLGEVLL